MIHNQDDLPARTAVLIPSRWSWVMAFATLLLAIRSAAFADNEIDVMCVIVWSAASLLWYINAKLARAAELAEHREAP